jgi:hypothetical protein
MWDMNVMWDFFKISWNFSNSVEISRVMCENFKNKMKFKFFDMNERMKVTNIIFFFGLLFVDDFSQKINK